MNLESVIKAVRWRVSISLEEFNDNAWIYIDNALDGTIFRVSTPIQRPVRGLPFLEADLVKVDLTGGCQSVVSVHFVCASEADSIKQARYKEILTILREEKPCLFSIGTGGQAAVLWPRVSESLEADMGKSSALVIPLIRNPR